MFYTCVNNRKSLFVFYYYRTYSIDFFKILKLFYYLIVKQLRAKIVMLFIVYCLFVIVVIFSDDFKSR